MDIYPTTEYECLCVCTELYSYSLYSDKNKHFEAISVLVNSQPNLNTCDQYN